MIAFIGAWWRAFWMEDPNRGEVWNLRGVGVVVVAFTAHGYVNWQRVSDKLEGKTHRRQFKRQITQVGITDANKMDAP